tara:strand:+ start:699 stop:1307 length:609 start_codon:yes stop_codon:yes gene_type:complete
MDNIILIGSGGNTRSCIDVIESTGKYKIVGIVEKNGVDFEDNLEYPVIGIDDDLENIRSKYSIALICVGQIKSAEIRVKLYQKLKKLNFKLPTIISPRSHVSYSSKIGKGTIIMHDVLINANVNIGNNCIINNKSLIEHDSFIGDHSHISTGAIINGGVNIGSETFIGSGVITKEYISVGDNCVIGAGTLIKNDIESNKLIK